jgi:glyoxylase-like metal-dependent hydrolase (beta-lactamase superfamily II)
MTPGHTGYLVPRNGAKNRQERAQKLFFADVIHEEHLLTYGTVLRSEMA